VQKGGSDSKHDARDITIITNDICFLADTNKASHKRGMDIFWERVKPHFLNSVVRRIQIVLSVTNAVVVDTAGENKESESNSADNDTQYDQEGSERIESLARQREISVADCLSSIQNHFSERAENEFKANRSFIQFAAKVIPSINITITAIENTCLGFMSILRQWSREFLSGLYRLTFALPETLDFDQCSVCLDMVYKIMPFSLDSTFARAAMEDLARLSDAELEVVKLVPVASIDASLLYGVPIEVRPALENDLAQHNQMRLLVRSLFKQMSLKDCALLLNTRRFGKSIDSKDTLFHSNDQALLLMVEEVPSTLKGENAPSSGVLYRTAVSDHLVSDATSCDILTRSEDSGDTIEPLSEYVDACMECLECSSLNPLYMEAKGIRHRHIVSTSKKYAHAQSQNFTKTSNQLQKSASMSFAATGTTEDTSAWTDASGVGSRDHPLTDTTPRNESDTVTSFSKTGSGSKNAWTDTSGVGSQDCPSDDPSSPCDGNEPPTLSATTWDNNAWTDTSGVGSRDHTGLSQDTDESGDLERQSTEPRNRRNGTCSRKAGSGEIRNDDFDDSGESVAEGKSLCASSKKVLINNKARETLTSNISSAKTCIKDVSDEPEFSDDLGDYCSSDTDSQAMSI
jgi:hypothetical protein